MIVNVYRISYPSGMACATNSNNIILNFTDNPILSQGKLCRGLSPLCQIRYKYFKMKWDYTTALKWNTHTHENQLQEQEETSVLSPPSLISSDNSNIKLECSLHFISLWSVCLANLAEQCIFCFFTRHFQGCVILSLHTWQEC